MMTWTRTSESELFPYGGNCLLLDADLMHIFKRALDAELAKRIARGDVCPVALEDMVDVNPGYRPRTLCSVPLNSTDPNRPRTCERKGQEKQHTTGGILNFFCKFAIIYSLHFDQKEDNHVHSSRAQAYKSASVGSTCHESCRLRWNGSWQCQWQANTCGCYG